MLYSVFLDYWNSKLKEKQNKQKPHKKLQNSQSKFSLI